MYQHTRLNGEEAFRLLMTRRLPGRLTVAEAAVVLGFEDHDLPVLVARGLIKPLGKPVQNASKYFSAESILQLSRDPDWLDRATATLAKHWRSKNERRSKPV